MSAREALAGLAIIALATPALAHAFLTHASPGAGAVAAGPPKEIALEFSEPLEPNFSGIEVSDAAGRDVEAAHAVINGGSMRVALNPLAAGSYRVVWRAVSVDTHRTQGAYSFTVKP
jgi:methionine-rich copper-binding protein CopC